MADLRKIADDLSKVSVLEAAELAEMLGDRWSGVGSGPEPSLLFLNRERTCKEPLRRGETLFEFYDSCASLGYDEFRKLINSWLAGMSSGDRDEMISRMRYGKDREFGACLAELSIRAFILGSGYHANPHPEIAGTKRRPDYAVTDEAGSLLGYVEVTTVNLPDTEEAERNRENPVYIAINAAKIPAGSILGYNLGSVRK
jgi:hypothetical protein